MQSARASPRLPGSSFACGIAAQGATGGPFSTKLNGKRTSLYRVSNLGGEVRGIVDDVANGDFSPDGRQVVFVRWKTETSAVGLANLDGSIAREIVEVKGIRLEYPRWSPDGAHCPAWEPPGQLP